MLSKFEIDLGVAHISKSFEPGSYETVSLRLKIFSGKCSNADCSNPDVMDLYCYEDKGYIEKYRKDKILLKTIATLLQT